MDVKNLVQNEGLRRGIRPQTINTYCHCLTKFFRVYHQKNPLAITKADIIKYIDQMQQWGRADNTINVHFNALKFFYEKVLHKKLTVNLPQKRIRRKLPAFLTQQETSRLFAAIANPKHQLMIKMLYATGMRVNELVNLKVGDFQFDDNHGWVRNGKGGKDRLFIIATKLKDELLAWVKENGLDNQSEGKDWLFPGQCYGHISSSSIRLIISKAAMDAYIKKNVHPHTLRHSFATHLIQNGYAVTDVQPLLGHHDLQTTMIYLHMASPDLVKVKSPYDTL